VRLLPHTQKFIRVTSNATGPVLAAIAKRRQNELGDNLMQSLLGENPDAIPPPPMRRDERFITQVFRGFSEIHSSLERLKDMKVYLGRFPFSRTRVTRDAYLQLMIVAHLGELYVLRLRLIAYTQMIARLYRNDPRAARVAEQTVALKDFVVRSFSYLTNGLVSKIRGLISAQEVYPTHVIKPFPGFPEI
jgi:hypothetical protein